MWELFHLAMDEIEDPRTKRKRWGFSREGVRLVFDVAFDDSKMKLFRELRTLAGVMNSAGTVVD